jgi:RNA polymerase sigma-70 factor (ECF subfamily)
MADSDGISTAQARQLSVLWTKAQPIVSAYFRGCLWDFHRAEDLLQETAAAVAESFSGYDPARSFTSWVLGIARNKLLHHQRTHANDRHLFDDSAVRELADVYVDMESEISATHVALESCIEQVQGRPRKLLEMRYVRELTPAKIAEMTGMNVNAVSVMLHRVRRTLRECIQRQLGGQRDFNSLRGNG